MEEMRQLIKGIMIFHNNSVKDALYFFLESIFTINEMLRHNACSFKDNIESNRIEIILIKEKLSKRIDREKLVDALIKCLLIVDQVTVGPSATPKYLYGGSKSLRDLRIMGKGPLYGQINPLFTCQELFKGLTNSQDIYYYLTMYLSEKYNVIYSAETIYAFKIFATYINDNNIDNDLISASSRNIVKRSELEQELYGNAKIYISENLDNLIQMFFHITDLIGVIKNYNRKPDYVSINGSIDVDYILTKLFGLKTSIPGFDDLFGGGLLLPRYSKDQVGQGKIMLVRGEFGTGKTILVTQLAFEIARKGGIVFVFTLDQNETELKQQFFSFGFLPNNNEFAFFDNIEGFQEFAKFKNNNKGVIGIGKISKMNHIGYFESLLAFVNQDFFQNFPLKLVIVDPINSVIIDENNLIELRNQTNRIFQEIKKKGISCIFTAEMGEEPYARFRHEQNIADYVIQLWVEETDNVKYKQRFIEIKKSRGQLTHRGRQSFIIEKGNGINIFLSSPAYLLLRSPRRSNHNSNNMISSGLKLLDDILIKKNNKKENGGFHEGDIVVYSGSSSIGKSDLANVFLLQPQIQSRTKSLFITFDKSPEYVLNQIKEGGAVIKTVNNLKGLSKTGSGISTEHLEILSFEGGFIRSGEFFQKLIRHFDTARINNCRIDKVVIDNVIYMEEHCPLISADKTFVTTLIRILRTENCTSIIICNERDVSVLSTIQKEIIDSSDCVINFKKIFFKGEELNTLHVTKSFGNIHDRKVYELVVNNEYGIYITQQFSLLKDIISGKPEIIPIRLFLHAEMEEQNNYNKVLESSIRNTLVSEVNLCNEDILSSIQMADIGIKSAFNELQIVQIDEHQMSYAGEHWLEKFKKEKGHDISKNFIEEIRHCFSNSNEFWALPFYGNISLLAYNSAQIESSKITDWYKIAELCLSTEDVVFDFPKVSNENINCLFLEIMLSLLNEEKYEMFNNPYYCLKDLFSFKDLIYKTSELFWCVGHTTFKTYSFHQKKERNEGKLNYTMIDVNAKAKIWRLWLTNLNHMINSINHDDSQNIQVIALPSKISIAGDWFIGVTKVSAAKDVGRDIIKELASFHSAQFRLEKGVGFPLNNGLFEIGLGTFPPSYLKFDPNQLIDLYKSSYRRSSFGCYFSVSGCLSYYLKYILSFPNINELKSNLTVLFQSVLGYFEKTWLNNDNKQTYDCRCPIMKNRTCKYK